MGLFATTETDAEGKQSTDVHWGSIFLTVLTLGLTSSKWLGWIAKAFGDSSKIGAKFAGWSESAGAGLGKLTDALGIKGGATVTEPSAPPAPVTGTTPAPAAAGVSGPK